MTSRDLWPCIAAMLMSDAPEPTLQRRSGQTEAEWVLAFFRAVMGRLESMWEQTKAGVRPHDPPHAASSRLANAFAAQINLPSRTSSTMPTLDSLLHPRAGPIHPSLASANGTDTAPPPVSAPRTQSDPRGTGKAKTARPPPTAVTASSSSSSQAAFPPSGSSSRTPPLHVDPRQLPLPQVPPPHRAETASVAPPQTSAVPQRPAENAAMNLAPPSANAAPSTEVRGSGIVPNSGEVPMVQDFEQLVTSGVLPLPEPGSTDIPSSSSQLEYYARRCQELRVAARNIMSGKPGRALTTDEKIFWNKLGAFVLRRGANLPVAVLKKNPKIVIPGVDQFKNAAPSGTDGRRPRGRPPKPAEYDADGNLIPRKIHKRTLRFDENGNVIRWKKKPKLDADGNIIPPRPRGRPRIEPQYDAQGNLIPRPVRPPVVDEHGNVVPRVKPGPKPKPPQYDAKGNLIPRKVKKPPLLDGHGNVISRRGARYDADGNLLPPKAKKTPLLDADCNPLPARGPGRPPKPPQYDADGNLIPPTAKKPPRLDEHGNPIPPNQRGSRVPQLDADGNPLPMEASAQSAQKRKATESRLDEHGNPVKTAKKSRTLDLASLVPSRQRFNLFGSSGQLGSMSTGSTLGRSDFSFRIRGRPAKTPLSFQRRDVPREMTNLTVNVALLGDQDTPRKVIDLSSQSSQAKIRAQDRRADAERRDADTWSPVPRKRPGRQPASAAAGSSSAIPDYAAKTPSMPRRRLLPFIELPSSQRLQRDDSSPPPSPTLAAAKRRSAAGSRAMSRMKPRPKQLPKRLAASRSSRSYRRRAHYRSTRSARQMFTAAGSKQSNRVSRSRSRLDSEPLFALSPDTEESNYEPSGSETEDDGSLRGRRLVPVVVVPQSCARRQFLIERGGYGGSSDLGQTDARSRARRLQEAKVGNLATQAATTRDCSAHFLRAAGTATPTLLAAIGASP